MSYEDVLIRESTGEGMGYPEPDDWDEILDDAKRAEGLADCPDESAEEIAK